MRRTVDEIAEELHFDKKVAEALVCFLVNNGLACYRGERPSPSGRGKGKFVYEVVDGAGKQAGRIIKRLE